VLRSITSDSAHFPDKEREPRLHRKYVTLIDNSIEMAYVNLIRNAEDFIYIENQYFMGSSYAWSKEKDTLAQHVIPREITQRIAGKIKSGEDFKVYITIPMYPEGDPTSAASQEILYWQHLTMESMFLAVAETLATAGSKAHPTDFLNFYCLGTREAEHQVPASLAAPEAGSAAERVRRSLRHPVYVHSKLMVVDDDYGRQHSS
jgi:phospholipase D1/2